jgi:hypothetical protein
MNELKLPYRSVTVHLTVRSDMDDETVSEALRQLLKAAPGADFIRSWHLPYANLSLYYRTKVLDATFWRARLESSYRQQLGEFGQDYVASYVDRFKITELEARWLYLADFLRDQTSTAAFQNGFLAALALQLRTVNARA